MATQTVLPDQPVQAPARPLLGGPRFDLFVSFTATWYIGGAYLDAWAHSNIPQLETFWTPWHGVLYSGVFATLCLMLGATWLNRRHGAATWLEAIPTGYRSALFGAGLLLLAGGGDAVWHTLFGIEKNTDALFSPTHVAAMIASALIAVSPLRAMYQRKGEPASFGAHLRLAYALTLFYAFIMVVAQPLHPFLNLAPLTAGASQSDEQLLAVAGMILQMGILTGCALYVTRRWTLRFGFFTFVLTVISLGLAQMNQFEAAIPISLIAGLLIDTAYWLLKPAPQSHLSLRLFAAITAAALPTVYLLTLRIIDGPLAWSIHLQTGSVVICGIFGWLLSYLIIPAQPERA